MPRRAKRLVMKKDLAELAGVTPMAITKATRGKLAPAMVGDRVDLDHPAVQAYLEAKGKAVPPPAAEKKAPKKAATKPAKKKAPAAPRKRAKKGEGAGGDLSDMDLMALGLDPADWESSARMHEVADMTLREVAERYGGTKRALRDWADALKTIEAVRKAFLDNEKTEGSLVELDLVKRLIFGGIEAGFRRLLLDTPRTLTTQLYAAARSGTPQEEAELLVRDAITSQLEPIQATIARVLRRASRKKART